MTSPANRNQSIIDEFRANDGQVGGRFDGETLLLLRTVGARSGQPRVHPVVYHDDGDRWLVYASHAGLDDNPAWYFNLKANPDMEVEIGGDVVPVRAEELTGAERDEQYRLQAERLSRFADYQARTSRPIPVIALTRR